MSLLGNDESNHEESVVDRLVGEGKKFKTIEDALKGKIEADEFIETLRAENETLKAEKLKQDHAKELLEKLQAKQDPPPVVAPPVNNDPAGSENSTNTPEEKNEVDLEALVEKVLSERDSRTKAQKNVDAANAALTELYGDKASEIVKQKAEELGVSVRFLEDTAANSATAFLRLIGAEIKQVNKSSNPNTTVRTESFDLTHSDERDWNFYKNLRKTNPSLYRSSRIQKQLIADADKAARDGKDFYKRT